MHIQITLHLISCLLIVLGVVMVAPTVFKAQDKSLCCAHALKLSWIGILVGVLLEVLAVYSLRYSVTFHVVGCGIILASFMLASPKFFSHEETGCCTLIKYSCPTSAWLGGFAAVILLLIALFIPLFPALVLQTVAYPLLILSLVLLMAKFFEGNRVYLMLSWLCLLAGFILQIVATHTA